MAAVGSRHPRLISLFRRRGIPCLAIPRRRPVEFLRRAIRRHRIQIVQSSDSSAAGGQAASLANVPHIWYVGGRLESTFDGPTRRALEILPAFMGHLSRAVVVPSLSLAREALPAIPHRKIRVIPDGVEQGKIRPPTDPLVRRIGMAANFYPAKRHGDFLEAALRIHRAFPEARFLIAGRCVGGSSRARGKSIRYRESIRRDLKRKNLERVVRLTEYDPDRWRDWFGKLDLLLIPSREGLSKALLEAGACAVPVVAADGGGSPEVIRAGRSGLLVPYRNPKAAAEAVLLLLRDPARARRMGRALRETARRRFSIQRQVGRLERLYQGTLKP